MTLKQETTRPPSYNLLQQQARFDTFIEVYNHERPHQALGGQYPGEVYTPSAREYRHPEALELQASGIYVPPTMANHRKGDTHGT